MKYLIPFLFFVSFGVHSQTLPGIPYSRTIEPIVKSPHVEQSGLYEMNYHYLYSDMPYPLTFPADYPQSPPYVAWSVKHDPDYIHPDSHAIVEVTNMKVHVKMIPGNGDPIYLDGWLDPSYPNSVLVKVYQHRQILGHGQLLFDPDNNGNSRKIYFSLFLNDWFDLSLKPHGNLYASNLVEHQWCVNKLDERETVPCVPSRDIKTTRISSNSFEDF